MTDDEKEAVREAAARKQREQDRQDLWREEGGLPSGRLARFIHNRENDPRTPEGQQKKRSEQAMIRAAEAIARWDAQRVTIAGVEMTNAEAQGARKRILDDPERYARWARDRGLIRAGQEQDLIAQIRRRYEIEDIKRSNGGRLPTAALEREEQALNASALSRAEGEVTVQAYRDKDLAHEKSLRQLESETGDRPDAGQSYELRRHAVAAGAEPLPTMKEILPTAPDARAAFAEGKAATMPLDVKTPLPSPSVATADSPAGKTQVSRVGDSGPTPGFNLP